MRTLESILCSLVLIVTESSLCAAVSISETSQAWNSDATKISVLLVSACVLVALSVYLVFICTDCYNAEVDSSSHPACGGGKSAGSTTYSPVDVNDVNSSVLQSSYATNEFISPGGNAPLPYSMISTPVAQQGFVGYQASPQQLSANVQYPGTYGANINGYGESMAGYAGNTSGYRSNTASSSGAGAAGSSAPPSRGRAGSHVNPMEEEPPPSYGEAIQTYR